MIEPTYGCIQMARVLFRNGNGSRSTQASHEKKRLLMIIVHEQGKGKNGVGALPVLV